MRTRAATIVLVLAVLASSLAVGCQRGEGGGGDGGGQRIGLSISTLNNPFFVSLRDGAQQAADEAGVELIISDAQNDAATQQDDVQNFVTQEVDAILVNPVDSEAVVPAVQAANQADIPVIALDRGASGGEIATLIASDNVEGGRLAGEELIELVGSGPVAQLEGIPGASPTRDRGQGFEEAINAQDAVELVASQTANFDRAEGLNVTENVLQSSPEIKGIFAQNDEMALGAVRALGNRAGTDVKIVGFDAVEDALKAIQDGKMNATVAQQPDRIGSLGVENAMKVIEGESVDENIPVPVKLVTEENVSEFLQ
ncbi:MAG TPA: D-ribose ABC transporter substrate-binding protein, partial [Rubrobacteraceae bacterium]|nr:D-ribose ABC transporter substrate-binding protein [Rubrobacteraceae bacterium]